MKIAIINLTAGGICGGYYKYLNNILSRMISNNNVESILCATPPSIDIQSRFNFLPKIIFITCKPYKWISYNPDSKTKKALKEFSPDVIFIPVERYFNFNTIPIVNMIQNTEPFLGSIDGNSFIQNCRLKAQYYIAKRAIKKSERVIAISRYVKEFLIHKWNIPKSKIGLIYHGADLSKVEKIQRPDCIPKNWEDKFIFTAGSIRPARGLEDILIAMKILQLKKVKIERLLIAGDVSSNMIKYRNRLKKWIQNQKLVSNIYLTGRLTEEEMNWCYRNCRIFVMTSRVESFGIIAGEAMAHGCVCISADNPCLPEIFGDSAIYYPPKKGKLLAEAICSVLKWDINQRNKVSKKAKKQAAKFSWDIAVEKLLAEFKRAIKDFD